MWSQPPQWLQASHYENVPHNQVDWASLAKQWISMQQQPTHPMMPPVLPPPPAYTTDGGPLELPGDPNIRNQDTWSKNSQGNNPEGYFKPRAGQPPPPPPPPPPLPPGNSSSIWVSPPQEFLPSSRQVVDYSHGGTAAPSRSPSVVMDYAHGDGPNTAAPERRVVDYGHGFSQSGSSMPLPPEVAPAAIPPARSAATTAVTDSSIAIDAIKRKNLPAWIRDGLEKMEREKQRKKEEEARRKKLEASKKPLWTQEDEEEAAEDDLRSEPAPKNSRRREEESDEELPDVEPSHTNDEPNPAANNADSERRHRKASPQLILLSPEEKEAQFAFNVKRLMTEILMSVLQSETADIVQEEIRRARNRVSTRPKKVTTALASIVGLAGYSDSDASDDEDGGRSSRNRKDGDNDNDSDLEERIRIRRKEFRKWEESAMKELDEKEKEQQRRLNGEEHEDSTSPADHGGRTIQRTPSPKLAAQKSREDRSESRSPKVSRKDFSEKSQDRSLSKDVDQKRRSRSRSRTKEHQTKEKTKRTSSRSSSSEGSRSSSKWKRSSKKDRRRSRDRENTRKKRDSSSRSRSRSRSRDHRRGRSGSRMRRQRSRSRDRRRDRSRSYDRRSSRDKSRERKSTRDRSRDRRGSRDVSRDDRRRRRDYSRERKRR